MIGVAKKKCKNKRVYALRGGWTQIGHGWMDERWFRPLSCTVKAELGQGQPELMR